MAKRTPADRARIKQAAAEHRQEKEMKQFKILLITTVVLIAVVYAGFAVKNMITLPAEIRDISTIQDNWIVIDTDNKVSKRYHHPASFTVPEGYTRDEFSLFNDDVQQDFLINAEAEDAVVESVYVCAASELTPDEYIERTIGNSSFSVTEGTTVKAGEPFKATINGMEASCVHLTYTKGSGDEAQAYGCLFAAFAAPKKVCVYTVISGAYTTPEGVQSAQTLLAEAETLLAGLTIVK